MFRSFQTLFLIFILTPFLSNAQKDISCSDTEESCIGKKTFADGRIYNGEFSFGQPDGNGIMTWNDGSRFEGEWSKGDMKYGSLLFKNGDEYLGGFSQNKINGEGSMIKSSGDVYKGNWQNGLENGKGMISRMDGSKFIGTFEKGLRIGEGKIVCNNKDTLFGTWSENKLEGKVVTIFNNGDKLIQEWHKGRMKVNGTYIFENQQEIRGSMTTIYYISTLDDEFDQETIESHKSNLEMVWYLFGMEFNTSQEYKLANDFLLAAQKYGSPNSDQSAMIAMGLERVEKEEKDNAWAKLPKKQ